jgi:hypothetical protein
MVMGDEDMAVEIVVESMMMKAKKIPSLKWRERSI